jgi:vacuolar-type H+-ATPase subunit C/Vma6
MKILGKTLFTGLLRDTGYMGYPDEYLLSRLRGRSAYFITDWESLVAGAGSIEDLTSPIWHGLVTDKSTEGLWRRLMKEYRWIYGQTNEGLRDVFRPFFLYAELRTIFLCLRYKAAAEKSKIEDALSVTLLSDRMKDVLSGTGDLYASIEDIERLFASLSSRFRGLKGDSEREGLRGAEQWITMRYLEYVVDSLPNSVVRDFFVRLIDSRNIIALSKCLRWGLKAGPVFTRGGGISSARLVRVVRNADPFEIASLIKRVTGVTIERPGPSLVEHALATWITKSLMRAARGDSHIGFILGYLWRCHIEARNLGILLYGKDLRREEIARELVL